MQQSEDISYANELLVPAPGKEGVSTLIRTTPAVRYSPP